MNALGESKNNPLVRTNRLLYHGHIPSNPKSLPEPNNSLKNPTTSKHKTITESIAYTIKNT